MGPRAAPALWCGSIGGMWNVMVRVHRHHDALSLWGSIQSVVRAAAIIACGFLHEFVFTAVEKVLATCARLNVVCDQAFPMCFKLSPQQALDKSCRSGKHCSRPLRFAPT